MNHPLNTINSLTLIQFFLIALSGFNVSLIKRISFYLPPYWSKQHGAYINLMISWVIALVLSEQFHWLQPLLLIFSLVALNLVELMTEAIGRKSPLPERKRFWLVTYFVLACFLSIVLLIYLKLLVYSLPVFLIFGIVFVWLSLMKKQKSVFAEWVTFAFLAFAGLLSFNPDKTPDIATLLIVGLLMSAYFGQSIFLVKSRLKKIASNYTLLYTVPVIIFTLIFLGVDWFTVLFSFLLLIKALQVLIFGSWYNKLKIKWVGMLELGSHLIFVLLISGYSNLVSSYQLVI